MRTILLMVAVGTSLGLWAEEKVDLSTIHRIKNEAFENSKVMEHLFYLTDVHGPRLTGSPGFKSAGEWVVRRLNEYGLTNNRLEKWGPFGRSWSYSRFAVHMTEPGYAPLIGFPLAWTPGTDGVVSGEPMLAVIRAESDFERWKGKLKDKIVMIDSQRAISPQMTAPGQRYNEGDLERLETAQEPGQSGRFGGRPPAIGPDFRGPGGPGGPATPASPGDRDSQRRFRSKLAEFLKAEGVRVVVQNGFRGDGGTVFAAAGGSRDLKEPVPPPMIVITPEHYNRIVRLLERKVPPRLEIEVRATLSDDAGESFNVIGEIAGGRKKDEVIMVGGHLDSWHGGTGATDNAAGCSVALEAVRILKTLNARLDRTVRIGLWGGEEQGLLGSKEYVKANFADPEKMAPKTEHAKLSGYFNLDNGTGKIRGVYLQGNDMMRPIFDAWLAPFKDYGVTTISIRNTGGTDHLSFDAVGLPGFQFIQDPVEYQSRTHHSNFDVYDYVQRGDMMQASAVMASVLYHAANRDEMLPRKPLPKPQPRRPEEKKNVPTGE